MPRSRWILILLIALGCLVSACSKKLPDDAVSFAVPPGFSGQVQVQLGVLGSPPLQREQGTYVLHIPADGKIATSTVLSGSPKFTVAGTGEIWGYTTSIYRTGDGLPVGGSLEFFVGTKEQFDAYEARKPKSQEIPDHPANRFGRQHILTNVTPMIQSR
jgi:hypothetical protein